MARVGLVLGGVTAAAALAVVGNGSGALGAPAGRLMSESRPVVARGDLLIIKRGRLQVIDTRGRIVRRLGRFRGWRAVQAMAISGDRRHAFVSIYRRDRTPRLFKVDLATGRRVTVADAVSPAVSSAGRLAYVTTAEVNDIDYRTALVVRTAGEPPREIPMGTSANSASRS